MPPSRFVLRCLLLVVLLLHTADCTKNCRDRCCTFLENFPGRLKELRTSFAKIRDYYEDKDEIETALLDEDVLKDFKVSSHFHLLCFPLTD
ncbi:hypothetical protein JZ751_017471 [Albula glossodonta]|uniref:Interleukin family protein n=1 Tax=Albula glossodonta TaxID=121402 RepID=A0A8T2PK36_9TELE|nr:hypothetical protein JZ751_017471 [Albula glossodonta]